MFNDNDWHKRFKESQSARSTWERDYDEISDIRDNVFDRNTGIMKDVVEPVIVDNVLAKSIQFRDAVLTGGNFFIDVEQMNNEYSDEQLILEAEINFAISQQEIMAEIELAKRDQSWYGLGWVKQEWNTRKINNVWKEGTPSTKYVDTRRMFIDQNSIRDDIADINYLFHIERFTEEDAKRIFPGKTKEIDAELTYNGGFGDVDGFGFSNSVDTFIYVIIGEYKKIEIIEKVKIKDLDTGYEDIVTLENEDDYAKILTMAEDMQELEISPPFEVEEEVVFSFAITYGNGVELKKPTLIGNMFSYTAITGFRLTNDPYPRGIAYRLKDLQIAQIIMLSVSLILTVKTLKDNVMIESGALDNEEQFMVNRHLLDSPPAIINDTWRQANPGEQPIKLLKESTNNYNLQIFKQILDDAQKTTTGATDPALGQARASDSGVKLAQMQTAASMFQKWDDNQYHRFITNIGTWLKETIPYYRAGKHDLLVSDDKGEKMVTSVKGSMFHPEMFKCRATVDSGAEAIRQQKIDLAMSLKQMGAISTERLLADLDINNPKQVWKEALEEQGLNEVINILTENPDLMDYVLNYKAQQKAIGQAGSAGYDTSNLQKSNNKKQGNAKE